MTNSEKAQHKVIQRVIERIIKKRLRLANKEIGKLYVIDGEYDLISRTRGYGTVTENVDIGDIKELKIFNRSGSRITTVPIDKLQWKTGIEINVYLGNYTWDCIKFIQGKGYYAYCLDVNKLKRYGVLTITNTVCDERFSSLLDNTKETVRRTFFEHNVDVTDIKKAINSLEKEESIQIDLSDRGNVSLDINVSSYLKLLSMSKNGILLKRLNDLVSEFLKFISNNSEVKDSVEVFEREQIKFNVGNKVINNENGKYLLPLVMVVYDVDGENGIQYRHMNGAGIQNSYIEDIEDKDGESTFDIKDIEKDLGRFLFVGVKNLAFGIHNMGDEVYNNDFVLDDSAIVRGELPKDNWETVKAKLKKLVGTYPRNGYYASFQSQVDRNDRLSQKQIDSVLKNYREKFFTDSL